MKNMKLLIYISLKNNFETNNTIIDFYINISFKLILRLMKQYPRNLL